MENGRIWYFVEILVAKNFKKFKNELLILLHRQVDFWLINQILYLRLL